MVETTDFAAATDEAEALKAVLSDLEGRSRSFGSALTGALVSATRGGKGLEDVLKNAGLRLSEIALSAGLKPLEGLIGSAITGLVGSLAGGLDGGLGGGLGGATAFATGGVPGRVTPFAQGGIVAAPTYFPMDGNFGLMGEAGSEAILPLKRGSDGSLGVAGGGAAMNVVFNVTATDAQSFRKSEGQIAAMLTRTVSRGRRGM